MAWSVEELLLTLVHSCLALWNQILMFIPQDVFPHFFFFFSSDHVNESSEVMQHAFRIPSRQWWFTFSIRLLSEVIFILQIPYIFSTLPIPNAKSSFYLLQPLCGSKCPLICLYFFFAFEGSRTKENNKFHQWKFMPVVLGRQPFVCSWTIVLFLVRNPYQEWRALLLHTSWKWCKSFLLYFML